ncbi:MAG: HPr family phosphocarrier protein [Humidesulfovibrio sp.]|jgi:phosphocarrier protein|uniref:HPr family phosphocarrier protein n=1 Tax=Humidesulfovibrio sp. TaxID=2910988 RepID=UPI00273260B6|nr:HPr family phosphocarrier protein [Humidesulfovibrio sp.]MDP2847737.1 HPr family phosphocarrier protein [Humidesulfovibrio sp.]
MTESIASSDCGASAGGESVRQVLVANQLGLHARPASQIAREAQAFAASISITGTGQTVDAKSILDVLTLAAGPGSTLEIRASGQDAEMAVEKISQLFAARFGEK